MLEALTLSAGYNAAVATIGATLLGIAAGPVGVFMLLRRRALLADAASHSTLPGIVAAFLVSFWLTGDGRSLPLMLLGAGLAATLGVIGVQALQAYSRLSGSTAIAVVLSAGFGFGVMGLSYVQNLPVAGQAGLDRFLIGQTAGMRLADAYLIAGVAAALVLAVVLFFKELRLIAFDPDFAAAAGWPVQRLDLLANGLLLATVVVGLTSVGLILIVALLIVPAVTARLWTLRLERMALLAAAFGGMSAYGGAAASAAFHHLPTGATIVLVSGAIFAVSLALAPLPRPKRASAVIEPP
jgi:manganese/zinc/iron transport system permease protein